MELLRSWGLEDEMRAGGAPDVEWRARLSRDARRSDGGEVVALGLPTKDQAAVISPTAPLCAPQDHTESVLLDHARSLGAEVEFGGEVCASTWPTTASRPWSARASARASSTRAT